MRPLSGKNVHDIDPARNGLAAANKTPASFTLPCGESKAGHRKIR
jgi:hypothetical protein